MLDWVRESSLAIFCQVSSTPVRFTIEYLIEVYAYMFFTDLPITILCVELQPEKFAKSTGGSTTRPSELPLLNLDHSAFKIYWLTHRFAHCVFLASLRATDGLVPFYPNLSSLSEGDNDYTRHALYSFL